MTYTFWVYVWNRVTNTSGCDDETEGNDMNYFEFVSDLKDTSEIVYCDVWQSLLMWYMPETHGVSSWWGPGDAPQGKTKDHE